MTLKEIPVEVKYKEYSFSFVNLLHFWMAFDSFHGNYQPIGACLQFLLLIFLIGCLVDLVILRVKNGCIFSVVFNNYTFIEYIDF